MHWLWRPIDNYCERTDASFWSEPLNAVSNLSFFVAAFLLIRLALRHVGAGRRLGIIFGLLLALIGAGSFVFHTAANGLGLLLDVVFIYVFVLAFLVVFLVRVIGRSVLESFGWLCVFITAVFLSRPVCAGPACGYGLTLFGLLILGLVALYRRSPVWAPMLWAGGLLAFSLTARQLDLPLCDLTAGVGTHFVWHLLNGAVLYLVGSTLVRKPSAPRGFGVLDSPRPG